MINKDKSDDKTIEEVKTASSPRGKVDADPKVVNNKHNVRVKVIPLNDSMDDEDRARIIKVFIVIFMIIIIMIRMMKMICSFTVM